MSTAAIIPARNEVRTIADVARGCVGRVDHVIVVDDGSDDGTHERLVGLEVECLRRPESGGKAAALADGFARALELGADRVVTLDGDGQHDPADIDRLLGAARAHPEHLVIGARLRQRHRQPGIRHFANRFADFWVGWASGQRVPDSQTGFRVYPAALLEAVRPSTERRHGFVFETAMLIDGARAGFPCVAVPIDSVYRDDARPSYFRPGKDVWEIFVFVFWRILLSGLYLPGLWRMATRPTRFHPAPEA
ncbi:glycosyltransferase family 2 protein [Wenzhouxiangella marina]|uniref:Glycosyl transferase family 2 n=1 Tax=Wenzhouxiangella marina TaxID=1579979 RepID=A0A0K0Y0A9_9GAMM|nr:glycosyltransferase family 2 protein [Wenzhouxiangella marina]AKS43355.1 glycosyl transferase family 2 [Wenzhouxiangella marina]MBB6088530.1 glycosyltransferase involved in cell wall biosynthesis [Wenzhouxiangella marina]